MNKKTFVVLVLSVLVVAGVTIFLRQGTDSNGLQIMPTGVADPSLPTTLISISEEGFSPKEITIRKGEQVTFQNTGTQYHWPASDPHPTHELYPSFDPRQPLAPGARWSFIFNDKGVWPCHDHLVFTYRCVITVTTY